MKNQLASDATLPSELNDAVTPVRAGWAESAAAIAALVASEEDRDAREWMSFGNEGDNQLTW